MIKVGIAGIGFMGMIHHLAYSRVRGARVVAIQSSSEKKRAGDWRGIQGNFGPAGEQMDLRGITPYAELDQMLADPQIDLVDICLPPDQHAAATARALAAGKHVVCEKPIALVPKEARRMVAAAHKAQRQLFIAHVLPYFAEFDFALRAVQSGKYGRLLGARFKRVISDPTWIKDFYNPATVGGPIVDLHIHDAHFIRVLCGMPEAVFASGRMRGDVVEFMESQWLYGPQGPTVAATSGVIAQQGRAFTHGYEIQLEKATLLFDFSVIGGEPVVSMPLTVLDARGKVQRPQLAGGDPVDGFVAELSEVCRSIKKGEPSPLLDAQLALDALELCHKQTESVRKGRVVKLA